MSRPIFLITLGAVAGAVVGVVDGGGGLGRELGDVVATAAAPVYRMIESGRSTRYAASATTNVIAHSPFSVCLVRNSPDIESALRNVVELHDHDATVSLVSCLLETSPAQFCAPAGRRQAADAMEIYFWSRDDARRASPARGAADKIRLLDRAAEAVESPQAADPAATWAGPRDRGIFDRLRALVKQGYLDPGAFAYSGRAELRDAVREVKPEGAACLAVAGGR